MRRVKTFVPAAVLCACAYTVAPYAQETGDGAVSVDTCANLGTREQQLECYEDRVNELRRELGADGDSNEQETTVAGDAPAGAEARAEREIIANITAIREMEPDAYLITLDNGQTWRQSTPKRYLLRVGAEVHLQPSTWGSSYRLTDPNVGNYIQVTRVK
jgi:hypothetical protein